MELIVGRKESKNGEKKHPQKVKPARRGVGFVRHRDCDLTVTQSGMCLVLTPQPAALLEKSRGYQLVLGCWSFHQPAKLCAQRLEIKRLLQERRGFEINSMTHRRIIGIP